MTRTESLALLHHRAANDGTPQSLYARLDVEAENAARSHGLAAVRAIRENLLRPWHPLDAPDRDVPGYAIRESRLAVRAALRAVGIPPTKNGHHNL